MADQPWPSEWLRGLLSLAVRRTLLEGPTYGYAISTALAEAGFGDVKGGTLYPLLSRLEASGDITSEWRQGDNGPGRKYFRLTPDGESRFQQEATKWAEFAQHTTRFINKEAT
ncbi:PadR family transcriptional regulator [Dermatophilus congolensis]|uniref:Lineage-specific thermal regulator protein n=1 Tax=Dermatophilus congolensis TaxID=1863 RepID=A0A239VS69_9MICO|nr:PadR family transcriptional regulator [Dermatophilus congolensis]MBO3129885.1 PadR family transcriptional regulator [Dermatophilus congolensis]MBO3131485.1 PadR family transcriptional regulator [Dermatophilus congolensis]MBO3134359.1 PadR family transcriptional regulator [Dermatophilus congolensis]MBO3136594.1 PadR family transcriptional regulator [Dermatophilus congolensis]MBO3138838.1 PadR family transcriptional regulator [Dermatophilus congolensis]